MMWPIATRFGRSLLHSVLQLLTIARIGGLDGRLERAQGMLRIRRLKNIVDIRTPTILGLHPQLESSLCVLIGSGDNDE